MTAPTGQALRMRTELAALMRRHNVVQVPHSIALAPPSACPMVLRGLASTGDLDFDRCRFAPHAFGLVRKSKTRLLYQHDPNQVAGEVLNLSYDPHGNLLIEARADHPVARRCNGFSVGGRIRAYRLVDTDKPTFYGIIEDCELAEVSLVEDPSNRFALVKSRYPADARSKFLGDLQEWAAALQKFVTLLPQVAAMTPAASDGAMMHKASRSRPARGDFMVGAAHWADLPQRVPSRQRKTSFGELAAELNNRLEA